MEAKVKTDELTRVDYAIIADYYYFELDAENVSKFAHVLIV